MEQVTISVKKRDKSGSRDCKALRKQGLVPGILYGHGKESVSFSMDLRTLEEKLRHNVRVMTLDFGDGTDHAIIKDLQWDAFGDDLLHADFVRVSMDEIISMSVRLESSGRAKGIDEGGVLNVIRNDVQVKCKPNQIPEVIVYDVSDLGLKDSLSMKDLQMPEGVTLDEDPEQQIITIAARVETVEEEPAEGEEGEEGAEGAEAKDSAEDAGEPEKKE